MEVRFHHGMKNYFDYFTIFLEFMADNSDFFLVIRCIYLNSVFYLFIFLFAIVSIQKLAFFPHNSEFV